MSETIATPVYADGRSIRMVAPQPVITITRDTIDALLDYHMIEAKVREGTPGTNARWWTIRRNGKTRHWARNKARIEIPVKAGLNVYGKITDADFGVDGVLNPTNYRLKRTGV